ncbi:alanine--glyoxylate aminotransferase 2, mitochondrial isoform X2 [Dendroctonus ponderosae]|uniref:alanine--glyoxylate aminotransferase 2, mitochondrial isoform X2 n=1 Tax=Dendroctonus ponderosae TaxID=77166 RepID=UPI0020352095|nr:alanine--glyoxylate aminotransferase 2, mitochondrial isoform X2 [Dendroctonus ponderosae]
MFSSAIYRPINPAVIEHIGPSFKKMADIRKSCLNPVLTTYYSKPLAIHQGHKQWLFDLDGKRYLDMFGGICTVSVGHSHPRISEAVNEQIRTLGHCSNVYYHPKIHEYAEKLASKLPEKLKVIYFVNSGSEANDLAVLLARSFTGKHNIVSFQNCYHGMTYQTMALTSNGYYKYPVMQNPGFFKTMNPDVYKGIWGGSHCREGPVQADRSCSCKIAECEAGQNYLNQFQEELKYEFPANGIAGIFAESIQGVGGVVQYPTNYIKGVHATVKASGGVFVSDEVQTGFGRTGDHFWGFESHDIEPDIVTMAKGIGNGFPLAAVATTAEVAQSLTKATHFNTFGGNPISSIVGLTVLNIIEEENLQENSKKVGTHLLLELEKLKEHSANVGDVRGQGLMIGVELVSDKATRAPLESSKFMTLWENCLEMGVILGKGGLHGNVLRIKPPMCITKEDADFTVEVLQLALNQL